MTPAASLRPLLTRPRCAALAVLLTLLLPSFARAATLTVAGDGSAQYTTIQAAVTAAASGDTVLVAAGTYSGPGNRDIDFGGKNLTVTSQAGAASTIIDCGGYASSDGSGNHRGFYIHSGETAAIISGFTVKNGYETVVSGVTESGEGGGICIVNSSSIVQNCTVTGNKAAGGGGVYNFNDDGGNGTITLTGCTVTGNTASYKGGGVYNEIGGGTITLTNCTVTGNTAQSGGGGVCNDNGNGVITLTNCTVTSNTAQSGGGGVYNFNQNRDTITLTNCTVTGNTAQSGGGVYNRNYNEGSGTITLTNCTVTGNAATYGGGVYNYNYNGAITLTNDIIYGDTGGEIANNAQNTSNAVASFSDIQGNYVGTGNINANPLFVNSPTDLHLKPGSPCLGAGTAKGAPTTDLDGIVRPNPPSIGAYEARPSHTHLLWSNTDGKAALWNVDAGGNVTGVTGYGPYTEGSPSSLWHATALATGPDGVSHIVWNNPDGHVALWNVGDGGSVTTVTGYGPYSEGGRLWGAAGLCVGPDGAIHLLWTNPDGRAAFWGVTPSGSVTSVTGYGPYTDGAAGNVWSAVGVSTGPDNVSHLLWSNTDGKAAFWDVSDADGSVGGVTGYGPYTDGGAQNLWGAAGVSVGPDGVSHLLWDNSDGRAAFWGVSSGDGSIGSVSGYGPYTDGAAQNAWAATALTTGPDNVSRLLWNNTDGKAALWSLDGSGNPAAIFGYGPYTDDSQPNAPQNLWSAVGVSAGP